MKIKTRFAPSPTGNLHIGGLRTALVNYAFTKANNGDFILRFEDTDLNRSDKKFEQEIIDALNFFDIDFQFSHRQSEKREFYVFIASLLMSNSFAYEDKSEVDRPCVRFDMLNLKNHSEFQNFFIDELRGKIENSVESNPVLLKTDNFGNYHPTYFLANTIDDIYSGITHVIRGEEWISSTVIQLNLRHFILKVLDYITDELLKSFTFQCELKVSQIENKQPLKWIHLGNIMNPETGKKLSKRDGDFVSVKNMIKDYDKETILTYLTQLGGGTQNEPVLKTIDDYIKNFKLKNLKTNSGNFDLRKMNKVSSKFLKEKPDSYFIDYLIENIEDLKTPFIIQNDFKINKIIEIFSLLRHRWNSLEQALLETRQILNLETNYNIDLKDEILKFGYLKFLEKWSEFIASGNIEINGSKEEIQKEHAILKWFLIGDTKGGNTLDYFKLTNPLFFRNQSDLQKL